MDSKNYSGFQLDEVHARNPVSLRNRVGQYLTQMKTAINAQQLKKTCDAKPEKVGSALTLSPSIAAPVGSILNFIQKGTEPVRNAHRGSSNIKYSTTKRLLKILRCLYCQR